ncbi:MULTISPECIES: O-methyltransferase [Corynebacterium]|uniref:O-methyltransferase n=1 Tax=Corynebacterium TaxID=1716 RepID=UPI001CE4B5BD|nr:MULTISPECIES: O-methyltransferase [Corynebacterium]
MNVAKTSGYDSLLSYIETTRQSQDATVDNSSATATVLQALGAALEAAEEFGLDTPDAATAEFLEFTAARQAAAAAQREHQPSAIIMSPASGVLGLLLARGFMAGSPVTGHLTCIEPDVTHQQLAKEAFSSAKLPSNAFRFLPSRPLDVVSRLTNDNYDIAIAECAVEDLAATAHSTLPALRPGGVLILLDSLMDGLVADGSRTDRDIVAARTADADIRAIEGAHVCRLPLGAGLTLITKVAE